MERATKENFNMEQAKQEAAKIAARMKAEQELKNAALKYAKAVAAAEQNHPPIRRLRD